MFFDFVKMKDILITKIKFTERKDENGSKTSIIVKENPFTVFY